MKASEFCTKAAELTGGDREQQHGPKVANFENIADVWNGFLRIKARKLGVEPTTIDAHDAANMMEIMKVARRYAGSHNRDDYVDGAGYAGVAGEIASAMHDET